MRPVTSQSELTRYFAHAPLGVEEEGLTQLGFGEYLVERGAIRREELFAALQEQDRNASVRLGECLVDLGILPESTMRRHLYAWHQVGICWT